MSRHIQHAFFLAVCVLLIGVVSVRAVAQQLPPEDLKRIADAMPRHATAEPKQARRVLIYTDCKGFAHNSIPFCTEALTMLGEFTGAYTADVSGATDAFTAGNLAEYDAIIFNNTTGELFTEPEKKLAFLAWIENGGGVVGIHAATDCFYDWPEFGALMGGYFDGHPWNEEVTLKIDDPEHPTVEVFNGKPFVVADEIYQFKDPYSRDELRVLMSLDVSQTNMEKNGIKRDDGDFAVSWVRPFGAGRLFYCSLGHRPEIFWNTAVLTHYLAGIQFALGDLDGEIEPITVTDTMDLAYALDATRRWELGQSRVPLSVIAEEVRLALVEQPEKRDGLDAALTVLVEDPGASQGGRSFACRQLALIGTEKAVPALAKLLRDPELSHMARYALLHIPGEGADDALRSAVNDLNGELLIGVINTIGQRGDESAIEILCDLTAHDDLTVTAAAIEAMGRLDGPEPIRYLMKTLDAWELADDPAMLSTIVDALLRSAEAAVMTDRDLAGQVYARLYAEHVPTHQRQAALRGLALTRPETQLDHLIALLGNDDPIWRGLAATLIAQLPGGYVTTTLTAALATADEVHQIAIIDALVRRGDRRAEPALLELLEQPPSDLRNAAIAALVQLGGEASIIPLARLAATGYEQARVSLDALEPDDTDAAIMVALPTTDALTRRELVRSLGARHAMDQRVELGRIAGHDSDPSVRVMACLSLAQLAPADDPAAGLEMLEYALTIAVRSADQSLVLQRLGGVPDPRVLEITQGYLQDPALGADAAASLLKVARAIGDEHRDTALAAVEAVLAEVGDDEELRGQAADVISHLQRHEGFITEWLFAGPFTQDGAGGTDVIDIAFAPETGEAEWQTVDAGAIVDTRICDILKITPGSDCCGYLRTTIVCEVATDARLELGSDDGIKVWLNGEVVHTNNAARGLAVGSDVVDVTLQEGPNELLLKITQGGGDWRACCRLRDRDGHTIVGLTVQCPEP